MNKTLGVAVTLMAVASTITAFAGSGSRGYQDLAGQSALRDRGGSRFAESAPSSLRFELVGQSRSADGTPVTDAKVDMLRVDMAPDGMGEITALSYVRPADSPGTHRVEIHPLMAGQWAVTLAARASEQSGPVRQVLTVALAK